VQGSEPSAVLATTGPRRRTICTWALATPFLLVNLLDGFNKAALATNAAVYWAYDLTKWVLLPAATLFAMRVWCGMRPADFGLRGVDARWSPAALAGLTVLFTVLSLSYFLFEMLGEHLLPDESGFTIDELVPVGGGSRWLVIAYLAVSAGLIEELFYRGILRELIAPEGGGVVRASGYVVVSSVLFGLSHFEGGTVSILASGLYGVVAALFALQVRNLLPLMVGHIVIDLIGFR
jgi:membrane protease YdiL (CAAX protease family)